MHKEFLIHTNYLFDWDECETLLKDDTPTVYAEDITLEEALCLIDVGYTAVPF